MWKEVQKTSSKNISKLPNEQQNLQISVISLDKKSFGITVRFINDGFYFKRFFK